jgi:NAD(P)-dependent dehydrogenase (short-subunit alcohol dehydrogenase family)
MEVKMSRLKNKTAVVTGGTSGIGLATAQRFVAEGAFVYIFAREQEKLHKTVTSIGRNIAGVRGDVRRHEDLADVTIESFNRTFDVNARGVLFTVQKSLPPLNNGASIILTSTIGSLRGFPGRSAYAGSKTALRSYARTWTCARSE